MSHSSQREASSMERIDLLWDAWEDCLCKEQLRAEFDRLTGQRDAYREETEGLRIDKVALTAENEKLSTKVATLQSQFDKISEPYHYSRDKAEYPWIRHEGKADGCPICNHPPSEKYHYAEAYPKSGLSMLHKGDKEDCPICNPKPSEKPARCEHKNLGPLALGGTQRCLDCHEWIIAKPFTLCTECGGAMVVEQMAPCPRCKPTHYEYYWGPNISTG